MYLVKNVLQFVLSQSGAFDIFHCAQFLAHAITIFLPNGLHFLSRELLANGRVVAEISLGADDKTRDARTVVVDFGKPFLPDVLKGSGRGDGEADQENVCLRI